MLGDTRHTDEIKRLLGDNATLGQFDGDWFWDTVAGVAKEASRSLAQGGIAAFLRAEGESVAAWSPPTKSKVERAGTEQPATRSQSKSEGGDKPQPEAEGRSR